jgi:hypothetical protein
MRPESTAPHSTLSLCLIVKNGERSLRQALPSARPFVDEMVVVDTGSSIPARQQRARSTPPGEIYVSARERPRAERL